MRTWPRRRRPVGGLAEGPLTHESSIAGVDQRRGHAGGGERHAGALREQPSADARSVEASRVAADVAHELHPALVGRLRFARRLQAPAQGVDVGGQRAELAVVLGGHARLQLAGGDDGDRAGDREHAARHAAPERERQRRPPPRPRLRARDQAQQVPRKRFAAATRAASREAVFASMSASDGGQERVARSVELHEECDGRVGAAGAECLGARRSRRRTAPSPRGFEPASRGLTATWRRRRCRR
jgi:hypothetical protein